MFPALDPAGTVQSIPPLTLRSRSASHDTDWEITPHESSTLKYCPDSVVVAVAAAGAQLKTPLVVENWLPPLIVTVANGIGKLGCSQPSGQCWSSETGYTPPFTRAYWLASKKALIAPEWASTSPTHVPGSPETRSVTRQTRAEAYPEPTAPV